MTIYAPVTLTWASGWTALLTRSGDLVTCVVTTNASTNGSDVLTIPAAFQPAGLTRANVYTSTLTAAVTINNVPATGPVGLIGAGSATAGTKITLQWIAAPSSALPGEDTPRVWLYEKLTSTPGLVALIGGTDPRVFAKKTMTSAIELHPYIVYKLGYSATEDLSEESTEGRQFIQIFVHDWSDGDSGDYMRIDSVIDQLKQALRLEGSSEHGVITCRYLETSQDLNDETLNTVFKYVRFQLIVKEK